MRQVSDQNYAALMITGPTEWVIATKFKPITKLYQIKEYQFKMDSRFLRNKKGKKGIISKYILRSRESSKNCEWRMPKTEQQVKVLATTRLAT